MDGHQPTQIDPDGGNAFLAPPDPNCQHEITQAGERVFCRKCFRTGEQVGLEVVWDEQNTRGGRR